MILSVAREVRPGERRAALVPESLGRLIRSGLQVHVESQLGRHAHLADEDYVQAGATVVGDAQTLLGQADLLVKVQKPTCSDDAERNELAMLRPGAVLVAQLDPLNDHELVRALAEARISSFSLDQIPRIARAQSMDVLSSMATLSGYKATVMAADELGKIFAMMMTAAGTIAPARVLVIGAGVAGLQAIATARRLGAVVKAIDTRPAAAEQVESLGAHFVALEAGHEAEDAGGYAADLGADFYRREQEIVAPHAAEADVVITTALIPGRRAPVLLSDETLRQMKGGAVIVDLAAAAGGNCELARPDERVEAHGVTILAPLNLPSQMPALASQMFSRNVAAFLGELLTDDGQVRIDTDNEILRAALITHEGMVVNRAVLDRVGRPKEQS